MRKCANLKGTDMIFRLVRYSMPRSQMTSAKDIYVFLTDRGGIFEDPASELHEHCQSNHKPKTAQWLSTQRSKNY